MTSLLVVDGGRCCVGRRYVSVDACRDAARAIANATFRTRQAWLWGEGSTAVASDSTHFRAFDQNIFTEWHSRYRHAKRGLLIYWTVETNGAMAIYSQHLSCSASEVHAMVEGAVRHGTARHRRGLTPLFTVNMTPYGDIQLNLDRRLTLADQGESPQ